MDSLFGALEEGLEISKKKLFLLLFFIATFNAPLKKGLTINGMQLMIEMIGLIFVRGSRH